MEDADLSKLLPDQKQPIYCYCSIGYRSSQLAQQLKKAGYTDVWNVVSLPLDKSTGD